MKSKVIKIPKLPSGNDAEVAAKLDELIVDASEGLRRIVITGFFLERIASELKHGEFNPWIEAHCKKASRRSVFVWRQLARNIMETIKVSKSAALHFSIPIHEVLALPASEVPADVRDLRAKIDSLLEGNTQKQLLLGFKQVDEDEHGNLSPRTGRLPGEGGKRALSLQEQAAQLREMAAMSSKEGNAALVAWLRHFHLLPELQMVADEASLEEALKFARWVRTTPPAKRDAAAIEARFKSIIQPV